MRASGAAMRQRVRSVVSSYTMQTGSIYNAFQKLDRNRSNFLSLEDLVDAMRQLGDRDMSRQDVQMVMDHIDTNNDGKV